jgi:chaperonin cofactor prefoldin
MNNLILSVLELQDLGNKLREVIVSIASTESYLSDIKRKLDALEPEWRRFIIAGQMPPTPTTMNQHGYINPKNLEVLREFQANEYNMRNLIQEVRNLEMYLQAANQKLDELGSKFNRSRELLPRSVQDCLS